MGMEENVVARLKRRIDEARMLGFRVRMEPLDGEQATWCEIAGVPTLFVDLSQTAAEQLHQVDEALASYGQLHGGLRVNGERAMPPRSGSSLTSSDQAA
jgi:hypothetical protein